MWSAVLALLGAVAALWPSSRTGSSWYMAEAASTSSDTIEELRMERLNLWIDGQEIEQFVGVPMDIFVIREGAVVHYLQDAFFDQQLPVIPPEVHVVRLTWQATDDLYKYTFSHLRSLDPMTLFNPLLSIPPEGYISIQRSDFQVTIPCTGEVTAIASMYIALHIEDSRGRPIPGSPIKLHLRKRCIAFEGRTICQFECKNGGRCNSRGQCECKKGYYGEQCQLAACLPECQNNGTCISPRKCQCMEGYLGDICQIPVCKRPCHNGGTCIQPRKCECPLGYYGNFCEHVSGNCRIPCKNGGTCTRDNECACPKGYVGEFCQKPTCRRSCGVHGHCVDIDICICYRGWRGKFCHKTVHRFPAHDRYERTRKKRRKTGRGLNTGGHWNPRRERRRQLRKRDDRRRRHSGGH